MNEAYQAGYDAFKNRLDSKDNPYAADPQKQQWDEGWEDAKMDAGLNRRSICSERESDPL